MIRPITERDLDACARIMMSVYNNELWQCIWSFDRAHAYLKDYLGAKFVGFALEIYGQVRGALFAHVKVWWNNDELYIDEMFVSPELQRKGYGTQLLKAAERYVQERGLAGCTLATNRYAPAPAFYRKNGFGDAEHVLFMYKVMQVPRGEE